MIGSNAGVPRRGFLERLAAAGLSLTALGFGARPAGARETRGAAGTRALPDEGWLEGLRGKHRAVLDVAAHRDGRALAQSKNFLDAYERDYGVPPRDVNLVLGVHGTALPIVFADRVWERHRLGEQYAITDPATRAPSTRNVFTAAAVAVGSPVTAEQTVEALQRRGVLFLACNNSLNRMAGQLAAAGRGTAGEVRAELVAGLLPGVIVVPAMVVAISRLQERGVSYQYVG